MYTKDMPKFINPFTDIGFKRIFGQEINKDLLIDFLNALLEGEKRVTDISENERSIISRRPSPGRESEGWTGGSTSRPSTACSS